MTLISLRSFIEFKFLLGIFNVSLVVMFILFIFYDKDRKINYLMALFGVNLFQWLFLIYVFFNNYYIKTDFYYYLIGAPLFTIVLVNQILKNHIKSGQKVKISMLKDKRKLILLFVGLIIIIGSLASFIAYHYPIFLYGITLGFMVFIYGFYHEDKKVNVSKRQDIANTLTKNINITWNYVIYMCFLLILQVVILFYFGRQISIEDLSFAFVLSINITLLFSIQVYRSDLTISNEKKENIIGICAILISAIIAFLIIK